MLFMAWRGVYRDVYTNNGAKVMASGIQRDIMLTIYQLSRLLKLS